MTEREQLSIEQLWYTWSEVGLGTISAGFRIRAASTGLSDIHSARVQGLERYVRYLLPPGTDHFAITQEQAPRCLAFIQTEQNETIIVHKQYTGRDGVGRPGNFFTHLLALGPASASFSAADAIWLWGSRLWQTSDAGLDQRANTLQQLPLNALYAGQDFDPQFARVEPFLPFLIEAYLTRREAHPIYLLTPTREPAMLASLIAGLVRCLPRSLLTGLTFSTYEPDPGRATTQLVGLSADLGQDANTPPVVPPSFYQQHLAINCATGEHSSLSRHPLTQSSRRATQFARAATRCLINNDMQQIDALLDRLENQDNLTVDQFLRIYLHSSGSDSDIEAKDIEEYISGPDVAQWLNAAAFREQLITTALQDQRWCTKRLCPLLHTHLEAAARTWRRLAGTQGQTALRALLTTPQPSVGPLTSARMPRKRSGASKIAPEEQNDLQLLTVLSLLARDAVARIKSGLKLLGSHAEQHPEDSKEKDSILTLLDLMDNCLFASDLYGIWRELLQEIIANRDMLAGLMRNWELYIRLLPSWSRALPATKENDELISPLLRITWSALGDFLLLHLDEQHPTWNRIALERLLASNSSLSPTRAQRLAQRAGTEIQTLLTRLTQETVDWPLAIGLTMQLAQQGYPGSPSYHQQLEKFFEQLVQSPQNWQYARDIAVVLTQSGSTGSKRYRNQVSKFLYSLLSTASSQSAGIELVEALTRAGYAGKAELLPLLLKTPHYQRNQTLAITTIYPNDEELATFFVQQGQSYLASQEQIAFMLNLYDRLKPLPGRQERLWTLLDANLEEVTVLQILQALAPDDAEHVPTLQHYGPTYLQHYQSCPQLAAWVIQTFSDLVTRGYPCRDLLFTLFTQPANPTHLETLLARAAIQLTPDDVRTFLNTYGTSVAYMTFCCRSETVLLLLERYARQITTSPQTNKSAQMLSAEKMHLLQLWLDPQRLAELALNYGEIEAILTAAQLQIPEQVQFLEYAGDYYIPYTHYLPHLQEYIRSYVAYLTLSFFDKKEHSALFNAISKDASLDTETRYRLLYWQKALSFFAHPSSDPQTLSELGEALSHLPIDEAMIGKLAQVSVFCIKEESDLIALAQLIQQVPGLSYTQMLYRIAELAGKMYDQYRTESPLIPYIIFALTCDLAEHERFIQTFLDALFRFIEDTDLDTWGLLHLFIEAPQGQPLAPQALERWHLYLNQRGLLNKVQKAIQKRQGRGSTGPRPIPTEHSDGSAGSENPVVNLWKNLWPPRNRS